MASSLLALLDDIASVLDDVSLLTQAAAKKTAGVLGDDLALNAQQVSGVQADRELPVVWAVAKGSAFNKLILVPAALAISQFLPWAVTPLLMAGGLFLCFEGFEKLAHRLLHGPAERQAEHERLLQALQRSDASLDDFEQDRIRGAIRTDFILSAEIITIALGTVQGQAWTTQLAVLAAVAALMTVGVYGLVAGIVKLDDAGLLLSRRGGWQRAWGLGLLRVAPWLMKFLSVAGTAAMFLVGGGILAHGLPALGALLHAWWPGGGAWAAAFELLAQALLGVLAGGLAVLLWTGLRRIRA